jgi:hypothetical protein
MLQRVVSYKMTDVSEAHNASNLLNILMKEAVR